MGANQSSCGFGPRRFCCCIPLGTRKKLLRPGWCFRWL